MKKKTVVVQSEFSKLATGYARVGHGLLNELHRSNKYNVIEYAFYCHPEDPRINSVPWTVLPAIPKKGDQAAMDEYNRVPTNVFGRMYFNDVLLQTQADFLIGFTDPWYLDYLYKEPSYLDKVNFLYCATCDAVGLKHEWINFAQQADKLFVYTDWSKQIFQEEGRLKVECEVCPPSTEMMSPKDKLKCKEMLGLNPKTKMVTMVSRNQIRKHFPELIYAFKEFVEESGRDDIILHLHSGWPDNNGWDFPRIIMESGLGNRILFTYKCECGNLFLHNFQGQSAFCKACNGFGQLSNVSGAISDSEMDIIYNAADLVMLVNSNEGCGLSVLNAASVGTPMAATNYSATKSTIHKLGGYPIKIESIREEIESGRKMAIPSMKSTKEVMREFFDLPDQIQKLKGIEARDNYVKNYSWEKVGKAYMKVIDEMDSKTTSNAGWNAPPNIQYPEEYKDMQIPNNEYAKWLIANVMKCPERLNTFYELNLIEKLELGVSDGRQKIPYDRRTAYNEHAGFRMRLNQIEEQRIEFMRNNNG
jgi:glycosyltransferase involved in cell wall biosynthesis